MACSLLTVLLNKHCAFAHAEELPWSKLNEVKRQVH